MTLDEWSNQITGELVAAGFSVSLYEGFPLVKQPEQLDEKVRLLKFRTSLRADRLVYAEGMLFAPAAGLVSVINFSVARR
jgi:hypothetical protein